VFFYKVGTNPYLTKNKRMVKDMNYLAYKTQNFSNLLNEEIKNEE